MRYSLLLILYIYYMYIVGKNYRAFYPKKSREKIRLLKTSHSIDKNFTSLIKISQLPIFAIVYFLFIVNFWQLVTANRC